MLNCKWLRISEILLSNASDKCFNSKIRILKALKFRGEQCKRLFVKLCSSRRFILRFYRVMMYEKFADRMPLQIFTLKLQPRKIHFWAAIRSLPNTETSF